jgi:hypothetical protein
MSCDGPAHELVSTALPARIKSRLVNAATPAAASAAASSRSDLSQRRAGAAARC